MRLGLLLWQGELQHYIMIYFTDKKIVLFLEQQCTALSEGVTAPWLLSPTPHHAHIGQLFILNKVLPFKKSSWTSISLLQTGCSLNSFTYSRGQPAPYSIRRTCTYGKSARLENLIPAFPFSFFRAQTAESTKIFCHITPNTSTCCQVDIYV